MRLHHSRVGVQRVHWLDGSLSSTPKKVRQIATQFYWTLLTEETHSFTHLVSRQVVLGHVCRSMFDGMPKKLLALFSKEELLDALRALARDSCSSVLSCMRHA